jgi:ammonium transporter Rh
MLATIEVCFYCINEAILMNMFKVVDIGGSMVIHTFGAFYGLAASFFF